MAGDLEETKSIYTANPSKRIVNIVNKSIFEVLEVRKFCFKSSCLLLGCQRRDQRFWRAQSRRLSSQDDTPEYSLYDLAWQALHMAAAAACRGSTPLEEVVPM